MSVPTVFAPIKSGDFTLKPVTVHKTFVLSSSVFSTTGSGYAVRQGLHSKYITPIGAPQANNDPTNSIDGSYKHVIWKSYDHRYYRQPYDSYATFEHSNRRYTWKFLNYSCSVLSIPYMDYGESIKPGSFQVTNSSYGFSLRDDGNGNLYSPQGFITQHFIPSIYSIGYWGFNNEFRRFRYRDGFLEYGKIAYESRMFEPDEASYAKNIGFTRGVLNYGLRANFFGNSYIITHDRPEFNPVEDEPLLISFWIQAPVSQSNEDAPYNTIIGKRGVIRREVYGTLPKYNASDVIVNTKHVSSSVEDVLTDVYPYDISFINSTAHGSGKIRVARSNGITITELTSSQAITVGTMTHVAVAIATGSMNIYINGALRGTKFYDANESVYNKHSLIFGATDRNGLQGLSGSLDEIRLYQYPLTVRTPIQALAASDGYSGLGIFQTEVVGNIFYRSGEVVLSPLVSVFLNAFSNAATIRYQSTHTIYQYEALCRVKKGSFNLTYNPTARRSFKSDLLIDDMTGSLLLPYATTIGLYNDTGDLVAVGKLGQPIQMRDDVDLNFLVKWDS